MSALPQPSVAELVAALPEVYQPIYGHPQLSGQASRDSEDRLPAVMQVADALAKHLGRPLRVLDLGCAQGFFALHMAARGFSVTAIDYLESNVALCRKLAFEHPDYKIEIRQDTIQSVVPAIEQDRYDLILGLSVFHHLVHQFGLATVQQWMRVLAERVHSAVFELALATEPVYWAASLPSDERELISDYAFTFELGRFGTHLSDVRRPLIYASNRSWYLDKQIGVFTHWSSQSHRLAGEVHRGTRRYYFSDGVIAKHFRLIGDLAAPNRDEIESEQDLLARPPRGMDFLPRLIGYGVQGQDVWLLRKALPGRPLIDLMAEGQRYDPANVISQVLEQLVAFEQVGLYHADLRVWNVLLDDDEKVSLIDYSSIGRARADCAWPQDLILSFFIFVHDVVSGQVDRILPQRQPFVSPHNLPQPYAGWLRSVWARPLDQWSFRLLADLWKQFASSQTAENAAAPVAESIWMGAIERHLDGIGAHSAYLEKTLHALQKTVHVDILPSVTALLAANSNKQQASTLPSESLARLESGVSALAASMASATTSFEKAVQDAFRGQVDAVGAMRADLAAVTETWIGREKALRDQSLLIQQALEELVVQRGEQLLHAHDREAHLRNELDRLVKQLQDWESRREEVEKLHVQATAQGQAYQEREALLCRLTASALQPQQPAKTATLGSYVLNDLPQPLHQQAELELLRRQTMQARHEAEHLRHQLKAQSDRVAALLGSTSWRITGPLRRLSAFIRSRFRSS